MSRLGESIRELRKRMGWTQEELAQRVGLSRGTIVRIESGQVTPSINSRDKIAQALGVEADDLLAPRLADRDREPVLWAALQLVQAVQEYGPEMPDGLLDRVDNALAALLDVVEPGWREHPSASPRAWAGVDREREHQET